MSSAYAAVFVLSIVMMIVALIAGAVTKSSANFGVVLWGYTAWQMYKRREESLVIAYTVLLWFCFVAFFVCLVWLLYTIYKGYAADFTDALTATILLSASIAIDWALLVFFKKQVAASVSLGVENNVVIVDERSNEFINTYTTPETFLASNPHISKLSNGASAKNSGVSSLDDEALYVTALNEISNGKHPGLWAMAMEQTAQGGSTEGAYIALRLKHLKAEKQSTQKANLVENLKQQKRTHSQNPDQVHFARMCVRQNGELSQAIWLAEVHGLVIQKIGSIFSRRFIVIDKQTSVRLAENLSESDFVSWVIEYL